MRVNKLTETFGYITGNVLYVTDGSSPTGHTEALKMTIHLATRAAIPARNIRTIAPVDHGLTARSGETNRTVAVVTDIRGRQ